MKKLFEKYGEIIRYLIIGGLTTVVSLAVYYLCVFTFLDPENAFQLAMANVISWLAAVTFAYFTNRWFVFRSKNEHVVREAAAFYVSRISTLLIDIGLMFLGVNVLHWNDKVMKLVVQVVVTIGNYIISKFFVFKGKKEQQEESK
jgi:putative flippase GtrA